MDIHRDSTAIVGNLHRPIFQDVDADLGAVTGHEFVNAIVDDLIDEVMETPLVGAADIHARPAANGFHTAKDLDISSRVLFFLIFTAVNNHRLLL
jgi:hypothetical protein